MTQNVSIIENPGISTLDNQVNFLEAEFQLPGSRDFIDRYILVRGLKYFSAKELKKRNGTNWDQL